MLHVIFELSLVLVASIPDEHAMAVHRSISPLAFIVGAVRPGVLPVDMFLIHVEEAFIVLINLYACASRAEAMFLVLFEFSAVGLA